MPAWTRQGGVSRLLTAALLAMAALPELWLITGPGSGQPVRAPAVTAWRYGAQPASGGPPLMSNAPARGGPVTITGATVPGATVTADLSTAATPVLAGLASTAAGADGSFSLSMPTGTARDRVTVAATTASGHRTGYARLTTAGAVAAGTTVLDVTDPAGDDYGPGTYRYPDSPAVHPGAFDLTRFQVISDGATVYLRTTLANLDPTSGAAMGAQLLDIYVRRPGAARTSTAAAGPSRHYTIAPGGAWAQRVAAAGFGRPVWEDAAGRSLGTPLVLVSRHARTITIALPARVFGTPAPGWAFTVVLTGGAGYGTGQARGFARTLNPREFAVCGPGGTAPVCSASPASVPAAMDVLTPPGVNQAAELDPSNGPVVIQPVPVVAPGARPAPSLLRAGGRRGRPVGDLVR